MQWTESQNQELKTLALMGKSNSVLAAHFGVPLSEIHAKRSRMQITIPKVRALLEGRSGKAAEINQDFAAALPAAAPAAGKGLAPEVNAAFGSLGTEIIKAMRDIEGDLSEAAIYASLINELVELKDKYNKMLAKGEKSA